MNAAMRLIAAAASGAEPASAGNPKKGRVW